MWYLIGVIVAALIGFFVYANRKKNKQSSGGAKASDKPAFRSEEDLSTYSKSLDDNKSHVDFDDAE